MIDSERDRRSRQLAVSDYCASTGQGTVSCDNVSIGGHTGGTKGDPVMHGHHTPHGQHHSSISRNQNWLYRHLGHAAKLCNLP